MNPRERELLTGMGNCFSACGEDFEGTVGMVADARHLTQEEVKQILARVKVQYGRDPEYIALRGRLPPSFPI